jgi:hypothetical protein
VRSVVNIGNSSLTLRSGGNPRTCFKYGGPALTPFERISDKLNALIPGFGDHFLRNKAIVAEKVVDHLTKENCKDSLDLSKRIEASCNAIRKWNGM